jgi:hypothetical protein
MRTMKFALLLVAAVGVSCCGGGGVAGSDTQQLALGSATTTTTQATPSKAAGAPPLGVNLEGLSDWARLPPFVDMMKTSRVWGAPDAPWKEISQVDARGWPTVDAGVVVTGQTIDAGDEGRSYQFLKPGTYRLRFTGKATVTATASPNVAVSNYLYDATANRSTADVVVGARAPNIMLSFRNTTAGVQDVSLRRPGYDDKQTFTDEFIQAIAPFSVLRFMDFMATNANPVRSWNERTTPDSATQATIKGGAYEYAVQMANELGKDIWINVPVGADDDHVRSLAELLKQTLAPGRVVYVEYSNELWNYAFPATGQNSKAAVAEALAGDTSLTWGTQCTQAMFDAASGSCNPPWAAFLRVGKRIVRISTIFSEVMGDDAFNTRFRPVFASQWANSAIAEQVLKNINTYWGRPSSFLYGIATAPYLIMAPELITSQTLTPDQTLESLQSQLDKEYAPFFDVGSYVNGAYVRGAAFTGKDWSRSTHKAIADYYRIKNIAYEGGIDMGQSDVSTLVKMKANRDSKMGEIVKGELTQWFGCGNDLFMYYSLSTPWGPHGYWGLTNSTDLDNPKYQAAREVAETDRAAMSCR